jgi:hypothetical protein
MAQHDYVIDNQSFPATRTDLNNVLQAIVSNNSGTSAPSTTFANQIWYDTATNTLFIRNEDNDANIPLMQFDQSADVAATLATVIDILDASGTDQAGTSLTIRAGAGTGTGAGGSIIFQTADGGSSGSSVNSHATVVTITDDGKVGIGTASPNRLASLSANSGNAILELQRANANTTGATGAISFIASDTHSVAAIDVIGDGDNEGGILRFLTTSAASDNYYINSTTERLRIQSGGGISFNGDTAAANALDDYEEGTWTPTYIGASSNPTVTYDIQVGKYVKVGGLVHAAFVLRSDAASGGSGSLFVSGLPFAGAVTTNAFYSGSVGYSGFFTTLNPQALHIGSNGTTIVLICRSDSDDANSSLRLAVGTSNLTNAANSNFLVAQMTYPTDA